MGEGYGAVRIGGQGRFFHENACVTRRIYLRHVREICYANVFFFC